MNHFEQNEVALVTGASRGIGRAIAFELARQGARVIGTSTSAEGAMALETAMLAEGLNGRGVVLDVTDVAAIEAVIGEIEAREGALRILVNNAGITRDALALRLKDSDWDAVIDTNLKAVFRLCKAAMKGMMKARYGRIVNITSVVGAADNPGQANYAAAKAGVAGMTRVLAQELGARGVTVNCVAPGFIDTDMTRSLPEAQKETLLARIPLGRLGDAAEVAAAVCFLASSSAGYITGTTLHVNGGMYMS